MRRRQMWNLIELWATIQVARRAKSRRTKGRSPHSEAAILDAISRLESAAGGSWGGRLFHAVLCTMGLGASRSDVALLSAQRWLELSPAARKRAIDSLGATFESAVTLLLESASAPDRVAAVAILGDHPFASGILQLPRLAHDPTPEVRDMVFETLGRVSRIFANDPALSDALDEALASLADAVETLPDRGVLRLALAALPNSGPRLARILNDETHPSHFVFRSLVRQAGPDLGGRELVRLLGVGAVAPAALDALPSLATPKDWNGALAAAHLLLVPARQRRLRRLSKRQCCLPGRGVTRDLQPESLRAVPLWLEARRWAGDGIEGVIDELIASRCDPARASLTLRLQRQARPSGLIGEALMDLSFDRCAAISRSALLAIADDASAACRALVIRQRRSPHAVNRRLAADTLRRRDALALLEEDDPFTDAVSLRHALKRGANATIESLRGAIGQGEIDRRIRAIKLVLRAGVVADCELELLAAAACDDPRLTATAVAALGRLTSASAQDALRACLHHADDRVRANAIEAAAKRDSLLEPVRASLGSPIARERCNAVHVMLERVEPKLEAEGRSLLEAMLADKRADHRRSALWLTERLGWTAAAPQVASLALNDADPAVRTRAKKTARRLLAEMRVGTLFHLDQREPSGADRLGG